jgi:hypothetical protein
MTAIRRVLCRIFGHKWTPWRDRRAILYVCCTRCHKGDWKSYLRGQLRELEDKLTYANDVKAERARCLAGANALRSGIFDDVRSLIRFISSGDSDEELRDEP